MFSWLKINNSDSSAPMEWKPNIWVAALLNLFICPLGMLYVARPVWAFIYLVALFVVVVTEYFLFISTEFPWLYAFVILLSVLHVSFIVKRIVPIIIRPRYSRWYGLILVCFTFYLVVFSLRTFVYNVVKIPSISMYPTMNAGSVILVSTLGYGNYRLFGIDVMKTSITKEVRRSDVIVFAYPRDLSVDYVMRVIGLPGEKISYFDKVLYINDVPVQRSFVNNNDVFDIFEESNNTNYFISIMNDRTSRLDGEFIVTDGHYFVLGDNRDNSNDSRVWGLVPQENIVRKVVFMFNKQ